MGMEREFGESEVSVSDSWEPREISKNNATNPNIAVGQRGREREREARLVWERERRERYFFKKRQQQHTLIHNITRGFWPATLLFCSH
jgi:hypothetical protein